MLPFGIQCAHKTNTFTPDRLNDIPNELQDELPGYSSCSILIGYYTQKKNYELPAKRIVCQLEYP